MPILRILEDSNSGPLGFGIIPRMQKWLEDFDKRVREPPKKQEPPFYWLRQIGDALRGE